MMKAHGIPQPARQGDPSASRTSQSALGRRLWRPGLGDHPDRLRASCIHGLASAAASLANSATAAIDHAGSDEHGRVESHAIVQRHVAVGHAEPHGC